jgi:hypothetical protein
MKSNTPTVKNIMVQYGLTLEAVSQRADCTMVEAYKALHLEHFRLSPLIIIARVRHAIEDQLQERGWNGQREHLWADYDSSLTKHLQVYCKAPPSQRRLQARRAISR